MFSLNPFATISHALPPGFLKLFLVVMVLAVIVGTLYDIIHKGSAAYFFGHWRKSTRPADASSSRRRGPNLPSVLVQTALVDVLASGEFCNPRRRIAHLLTMYGFIAYLVTTVMMVFGNYPSGGVVPLIWWIGAFLVCIGGYWFWFFIRVDVAAEGNSPLRIVQADLFVLSLVASVTLGLVWAAWGGGPGALFWLYLVATAVLFGSVPWSKFAHMFFKPAAALEKRVSRANGTAQNLPLQTRDDPEQRERHSMELLKNAPMDMGLGIKREAPRHY